MGADGVKTGHERVALTKGGMYSTAGGVLVGGWLAKVDVKINRESKNERETNKRTRRRNKKTVASFSG